MNNTKLIFINVALDSNEEHELIAKDSNLGYDVTVQFQSGMYETFRNVTEVHWLYENTNRIAIESDIHGTGITYATHAVSQMRIDLALTKSTKF